MIDIILTAQRSTKIIFAVLVVSFYGHQQR